ncbi:hypothetical protein ACLI4Z_09540 [Natrialbaceae archaeon A-arb3/5]
MTTPPKSNEQSTTDDRSTDSASGLRAAASAGIRIGADLLVLTLWVLFLTLLFLGTAWPRWAFYALLLVGVVAYVSVTVPWTHRTDESE